MDTTIGFRPSMFVYACESSTNPASIKVMVPEAFMHSAGGNPTMVKLQKRNGSIFLNATPPAINSYIESYNYITLPVISQGKTFTKIGVSTYSGNTGIGDIGVGTKLIAEFTNGNPKYGLIIARC